MGQRYRLGHAVGINEASVRSLKGQQVDTCSSKELLRLRGGSWGRQTLTHHNPIGHEEHHPSEDMDHEEGHRQTTQVIVPTAAEDISVTCDRAGPRTVRLLHLITASETFLPPAECSLCSTSGASAPWWFSIASSSLSRRREVPLGQQGMSCSRYIRKRTAMGTGS